jgi:hypothetical protein
MHRSSAVLALLFCLVAATAHAAGVHPMFTGPSYSSEHLCDQSVAPGHVHCDIQVVTHATTGNIVDHASPLGGYTPYELQDAYGVLRPAASQGADQTVAIVDAYDDPNAEADLGTYRTQYGLPACTTANHCFTKVNQSGASSPLPVTNGNWAGEIALDLDMVSAICPNCHILLVEASSAIETDMAAATQMAASLGATAISNSYGGPESSGEASFDASYNHPGIPITVSSGDGAYGSQYPASSPKVTAVGGTSLLRDTSSRGWSESAWNAAGSGCSAYESKPSWQTDTTGCPSNRTVADVSAVADPATGVNVYDSFPDQGDTAGWMVAGGTSASAPIVAAFDALGDSSQAGVLAPASFFYTNSGLLNDVTTGNNALSCPPAAYLCTAGTGYDGPTGLGTINGNVLGTLSGALAGYSVSTPVPSPGTTDGITYQSATLHGTVNPEGHDTTYYFDYGSSQYALSGVYSVLDAGSGTSPVQVSRTLTNINAGEQYYWRLVAVNADGTRNTTLGTFTTKLPPPIATTAGPGNLTTTSVDLNGQFESQGLATTYHFDYGPTTSYGSSTSEQDGGNPGSYTNVTQSISGLTSGKTYHYRFVATNSSGTTYGADGTFTTYAPSTPAGGSPTPTTPTPTTQTTQTPTVQATTSTTAGPTPPATAATTSAPAMVVATNASLSTILAHGMRATVSCDGGCLVLGSIVAPAALAKKYKLGPGNTVIGKGTLTLAHGGMHTIVLHVSSTARKRLRHVKSLKLTLQLVVSDASGKTHKLTRAITIRR